MVVRQYALPKDHVPSRSSLGLAEGRENSSVAHLSPQFIEQGRSATMKRSSRPAPSAEVQEDFLLAEVDSLIASTESRIERQRTYVRSVASDFEASMKAVSELDLMLAALEKLRICRQRMLPTETQTQGTLTARRGSAGLPKDC